MALESMVINTEDIPSYGYTPTEINDPYQVDQIYWYPYTVITTADMASYYDDFVEWECMKGIPAGVVTVEDIRGEYPDGDLISGINDEAGSIRQYLTDGWEHYGLVYALLGGDEDAVESRNENEPSISQWYEPFVPADFYFSEFNSIWYEEGDYYSCGQSVDYFPEIFVGRLTANNQQNVSWWFNKLKKYETAPGDGDHLFRMLWTQSDQMQQGQQVQDQWLTGASWWPGFIESTIFEEVPSYNSLQTTDPQGADVINEINQSPYYGWVTFYGHGGTVAVAMATNGVNQYSGGWGLFTFDSYSYSPWFQNESGNGLDNISNAENKYPIMYTIACASFYYDNNDDIYTVAEGFTCFDDKGGPAAMANTRIGLTPNSHILHSWFLKEVWDEDNYVIGSAFGIAKVLNNASKYTLTMNVTLGGSPEMNIWITNPLEFSNISHPLSIPEGGNSNFTVSTGVTSAGVNGEWPIVCIYQEGGGFYEFGETDSNGDITFDIDLTSNYRLWVTADRYDYIPYQ